MNGFSISPGRYHFDGQHALAYARIRKAAGESDFTRAARQQEVIAALRDRLVGAASWRTRAGSCGRWARRSRPTSSRP